MQEDSRFADLLLSCIADGSSFKEVSDAFCPVNLGFPYFQLETTKKRKKEFQGHYRKQKGSKLQYVRPVE